MTAVYKDEFAKEAVTLCEMGATMEDLAQAFEVSRKTIYAWMQRHQAFGYAIKVGKAQADKRVEMSMFSKACGFTAREVKRKYKMRENDEGKEYPVLESEEVIEKTIPPDTTAGIFWLKNRVPDAWRDRREFTGADGEPLNGEQMPPRQLAAYIIQLIESGAIDEESPLPTEH